MRFELATYSLVIPDSATVRAEVARGPQDGTTVWRVDCGRHHFTVSLSTNQVPAYLATFICSVTREDVHPSPISINGIDGVYYGSLGVDGQIDWWLRRGELMICMTLRGPSLRSAEEQALHEEFVHSLRYLPGQDIQ